MRDNVVVVWIVFAALFSSFLQSVDATVFRGFFEEGSQPDFTYTYVPAGTDQVYFTLVEGGSRVNVFLYTLEEDATVTIEVKADVGSDIDPAVVLLHAETLIVVDVDDDDKYSCDAITTLAELDSCMTNDLVAGDYFIAVTGVGGSFGKYVINVDVPFGTLPDTFFNVTQPKLDATHIPPTPSPATPPTHVFQNPNDLGNGLYNFLLLPSGTNQVLSQLENDDDDDVYYYILEEAAVVTIEAKARGSNADMFMIVLDASTYGLIGTDDDNEDDCEVFSTLGEFDSCLTLDLDAGVYVIVVESADNDKFGNYEINLSVPSGDISFALPPSGIPPTKPPTPSPTSKPVVAPTSKPVVAPTSKPVVAPTANPVPAPTLKPTSFPTTSPPTSKPTHNAPTVIVNVPPGLCFSGNNQVEVEAKGFVAMKDVRIGDNVRDAKGEMVSVYSFGHYHATTMAEYLQIFVAGLKQPLEISKDHLMFVNGTAIPASSAVVGDVVSFAASAKSGAKIQKIKNVVRSGAYAPFTTSGTIMVSGLAASSYVTLQVDSPVLVLGQFKSSLSMHWLAHVFQAPHRLICSLLGIEFCRKTETYNQDGISNWVQGPYYGASWCLKCHGAIAAAMLVPAFLFVSILYALEVGWVYCVALFGALYVWNWTKVKKMA